MRTARLVLTAVGIGAAALRIQEFAHGQADLMRESAASRLWPVFVVLVASVGIRSRSTVQVIAAGLGGFFTSVWLSQVLGEVAIERMGVASPVRLSLVIPMLEEAAKAVPLLIVAVTYWRRRGAPGIVDFGLLGMASGAGYAIHEDALWSRVASRSFDEPVGLLLSSTYAPSGGGVVAGHVVWTGLVGLAIGVAVTRRRLALTALVALAMAAVVFDHGSWNLLSLRDDWRVLVANGWLTVGSFGIALVTAFVHDAIAVSRLPRSNRLTPLGVCRYSLAGESGNVVSRLVAGSRVLRTVGLAAHVRRRDQRAPTEHIRAEVPA